MERLDSIHHRLLERPELDSENLDGSAVIVFVNSVLRILPSLDVFRRQFRIKVRVSLSDDLDNFLIAKITSGDEEALTGCGGNFNCLDMGQSQVSDIYPNVYAGRWNFILALAQDDIPDPLVGGVEGIQGVEIMH